MTEVRRVGRYEPVIAIGTGGMATVYLARAPLAGDVGREVALKLVHPHLRESEEAASTLIEEAKLAARIRHPNVVPVREVGQDAAGIYLVMDYVEGATLSKLMRSGDGVPLPIAARILSDALAGLHAAHELKDDDGSPLHLVHRDFSPQNVLVGADGVTRLTDFGIARAASRPGVTSVGVVKGKIGYLSPEQALGKPLDRRSDIWAAGIVAWELLAGRRLYDSDDEPVSAMMRIVSETPPRLRSVRPELSPLIDQAVATALSLEPDRRWPSADELARALSDGFRAHGGSAEPEEVGAWVHSRVFDELAERRRRYRARAPVAPAPERRSKLWLWASAGLLCAAAIAGAMALMRAEDPPAPAASATPPPTEIAPARVLETAAEPSVRVSPDAALVPRETSQQTPIAPRRSSSARRMPSLGPNPYRKP